MHTPVLLREAVDILMTDGAGIYVDCTFGRGGHSRAILERLGPAGRLLALDRDPEAVACGLALAQADARVQVEHARFDELDLLLERHGMAGSVQGILLDLGVSSPQLDDARRGFSFIQDGPLDMRMDPTRGISAAQWLARAREADIEHVLREYGEERFARRMAAAIVRERLVAPIETTGRLAAIVAAANPAWEKGKHPATRAFQAIRIYLNEELDALQSVLRQALAALQPGGRLAVISFHSLEDRIVKRFMRDQARRPNGPDDPQIPAVRLLGKAIKTSDDEARANPRARSAVLRAAERLTATGQAVDG